MVYLGLPIKAGDFPWLITVFQSNMDEPWDLGTLCWLDPGKWPFRQKQICKAKEQAPLAVCMLLLFAVSYDICFCFFWLVFAKQSLTHSMLSLHTEREREKITNKNNGRCMWTNDHHHKFRTPRWPWVHHQKSQIWALCKYATNVFAMVVHIPLILYG